MDPASHPCGHDASIMKMDFYIEKDTLRIVPNDQDPGKFWLEFFFNARVDGSITIQLFQQLGEDMRLTEEHTADFQNDFVNIFLTGINTESSIYHLVIKAVQASPCISESEDGSSISEVIVAVIETKMGECLVIRSIDEMLLVNEVEYVWHDIDGSGSRYDWNDPGKECLLCSIKSAVLPPPLCLAVYNQIQHPKINMATDSAVIGQASNSLCRHGAAIMNKDINIRKETLKVEPDQEHPGKHLVEFIFDAAVAGSITVYTLKELELGIITPIIRNLPPPITVVFEQGFGQKFKQGIDLSLFKYTEETYILTFFESVPPAYLSEDGRSRVFGTAFIEATVAKVVKKEKDEWQVSYTTRFFFAGKAVCLWRDHNDRFGSDYDCNDLAIERPLLRSISSSQYPTTVLHAPHQIDPKLYRYLQDIIVKISFAKLFNEQLNNHHKMPDIPPSIRDKLRGRLVTHKIGKIVVLDEELGMGSDGTVVYGGFYEEKREVAVKRMVKKHRDVASEKQIEILTKSDYHPNIVKWYGTEKDKDFVYIALERCQCTLHDLITSLHKSGGKMHPTVDVFKDLELWKNDQPSFLLLILLRDTVKGLAELHKLGIIHRDLKPQNVLICQYKSPSAKVSGMDISAEDMGIIVKVSDMGISKLLPDGADFLTKSTSGSSGWKAPERLLNKRETNTVDAFSLGCLIFFCITGGEHPFGKDWCDRDGNIKKDEKDLSLVANIPEAHDLISRLLDSDPKSRLQVAAVLNHPLFWDPKKRLDFLQVASDRAEKDLRKTHSGLLDSLKSKGPYVFGADWETKLHQKLLEDLKSTKQVKYIYSSLYSLLRAIRNKLHHYPPEVEAVIGTIPTGFEEYFRLTFPGLLMVVYEVLKEHCGEEQGFLSIITKGRFPKLVM